MRLIDADALHDSIDKETYRHTYIEQIHSIIDTAPTIDAEPVKHGKWEQHDGCVLCKDDDTYFYTCSCCKMAITEAERGLFNFCPNCGAKMDKEKNNG